MNPLKTEQRTRKNSASFCVFCGQKISPRKGATSPNNQVQPGIVSLKYLKGFPRNNSRLPFQNQGALRCRSPPRYATRFAREFHSAQSIVLTLASLTCTGFVGCKDVGDF